MGNNKTKSIVASIRGDIAAKHAGHQVEFFTIEPEFTFRQTNFNDCGPVVLYLMKVITSSWRMLRLAEDNEIAHLAPIEAEQRLQKEFKTLFAPFMPWNDTSRKIICRDVVKLMKFNISHAAANQFKAILAQKLRITRPKICIEDVDQLLRYRLFRSSHIMLPLSRIMVQKRRGNSASSLAWRNSRR